jgi:hypothetical protein
MARLGRAGEVLLAIKCLEIRGRAVPLAAQAGHIEKRIGSP